MVVIADTSPLNYLVWIGLTEILPKIYGKISIPLEVRTELMASDAPQAVQEWARNLPDWVEVRVADVSLLNEARWAGLDRGEKAALALAMSVWPSLLIIDERAGSATARGLGLNVTGTLGVLDEAARRGLISLPDAIARLERTSFRYPKSVVKKLLEEDAERSGNG